MDLSPATRSAALSRALARIEKEIAGNNTDGARTLYLQAIEIFLDLLRDAGDRPVEPGDIILMSGKLEGSKPSMAPLLNLAAGIGEVIVNGRGTSELVHYLERCSAEAGKADGRLSRNFGNAIRAFMEEKGLAKIDMITLSSSSAVRNGIVKLLENGIDISLTVAESRPVCEGTMMAAELGALGAAAENRAAHGRGRLEIALVTDAAVPGFTRDSDLALVGCDALLPDVFVNKTGTMALALAARYYGRPLWVLAGKFKTLDGTAAKKLGFPDEEPGELLNGTSVDVLPGNVRAVNRYFETVPRELVERIITD